MLTAPRSLGRLAGIEDPMAKLWQKDYEIDSLIERFTVGNDFLNDQHLILADIAGSIAHTWGLRKSGLLSEESAGRLEAALRDLARQTLAGGIVLTVSDEDCHTRIENELVAAVGEDGKRIHLGRSRNDQVMTALRLWGREVLLDIRGSLAGLAAKLLEFAEANHQIPMPGRTHMQVAMPSSVGLWAAGFAELVLDDLQLSAAAARLVDRSPLGSAAGYGVPLELNRELTAEAMGFADIIVNPIASNASRGKYEAAVLDALDQVGLDLGKFAQDLITFSLPEFGYFSLPDELTSGSSIMPQKKNPDGLELLRGRSGSLSGWAAQVKSVIRNLPSGYNRDLQDTKEPFMRGLSTALDMILVADLTVRRLRVNGDALRKGMAREIWATDEAIALVAGGLSFREAYKKVAVDPASSRVPDEKTQTAARSSLGHAGKPGFNNLKERLAKLEREVLADRDRHNSAVSNLLWPDARLRYT